MTRQCRYALKQIKTLSDNSFVEISYSPRDDFLCRTRCPSEKIAIVKYSNEYPTLIDELAKQGYISMTQFGFQLTHKGIHPYEVTLDELKKFLFHSVFIPVLVSVATTLLTLCIKALL